MARTLTGRIVLATTFATAATAVLVASTSAVALDGRPATLTVKQAGPIVKQAIRAEYTIGRRYSRTCKRRSRLTLVCQVRWADEWGTWMRARVTVTRTGTRGATDHRYAVDARGDRNDAERRYYRGLIRATTRRALIGRWITMFPYTSERDRDDRLVVRLRPGVDPAEPSDPDSIEPGHRPVTFWLDIQNRTNGSLSNIRVSSTARLVLVDGRMVAGDSWLGIVGCDDDLLLPERETRTVCLSFELPHGAQVRALDLQLSEWETVAQWRL